MNDEEATFQRLKGITLDEACLICESVYNRLEDIASCAGHRVNMLEYQKQADVELGQYDWTYKKYIVEKFRRVNNGNN